MNVNKLFPSRFIKADDLGGQQHTLTITRVIEEKVRGERGEEEKAVAYFEKAKKGLLLNKTNAMTIAALYGPETDGWAGCRVTLYAKMVPAFGSQVLAVRVVEKVPPKASGAKQAEEPPAALNEDVPEYEDAE